MKHLKKIFRTLGIAAITLFYGNTPVMAQQPEAHPMDSVEIGLLTCSPHEEIYSLYGHSALRYHDLRTGEDLAFNWGIFNFKKPHFVLRFTFGLTDYELGVVPFRVFCKEYERFGSQVTEQVLNLTAEEKQRVHDALAENCREENRVYRYNFFYDNCSTRPRDIIEKCVNGEIKYTERQDDTPTYREMIHQYARNHDWAKAGNDLCLGVKADLKTSRKQQEFLPENLMTDFSTAQIVYLGTYRPLVKENRVVVQPGVQLIQTDFPLTPIECGILLLLFSLLVFFLERKRKTLFKWWNALLMLAQGIAGIVVVMLFFSQHPTTSTNLQVFLLNPIPLFYLPQVIRGRESRYWHVLLAMVILFFLGGIWQHYAEGMYFVALCLLLRIWQHITYKHAK